MEVTRAKARMKNAIWKAGDAAVGFVLPCWPAFKWLVEQGVKDERARLELALMSGKDAGEIRRIVNDLRSAFTLRTAMNVTAAEIASMMKRPLLEGHSIEVAAECARKQLERLDRNMTVYGRREP